MQLAHMCFMNIQTHEYLILILIYLIYININIFI